MLVAKLYPTHLDPMSNKKLLYREEVFKDLSWSFLRIQRVKSDFLLVISCL